MEAYGFSLSHSSPSIRTAPRSLTRKRGFLSSRRFDNAHNIFVRHPFLHPPPSLTCCPLYHQEWHKKARSGTGTEEGDVRVLRSLIDLMSQAKSSMPSNGGACVDDHEAVLGVFGYSCSECKSVCSSWPPPSSAYCVLPYMPYDPHIPTPQCGPQPLLL